LQLIEVQAQQISSVMNETAMWTFPFWRRNVVVTTAGHHCAFDCGWHIASSSRSPLLVASR